MNVDKHWQKSLNNYLVILYYYSQDIQLIRTKQITICNTYRQFRRTAWWNPTISSDFESSLNTFEDIETYFPTYHNYLTSWFVWAMVHIVQNPKTMEEDFFESILTKIWNRNEVKFPATSISEFDWIWLTVGHQENL